MLVHTLLHGKRVGADEFGNVYYRGKPRKGTTRERRWVMYKNAPEASAVPPEWHGWLHHQTDVLPQQDNVLRRPWQKPHIANQTGSYTAYLPPGHVKKGGHRAASTGDYTPWTP
jgi:NADH:ubiquinone oxidoreductase subunit